LAEEDKVDAPLDANAYVDAYHTAQGKTGFIDRLATISDKFLKLEFLRRI
jgi:hypothetical protein